MELLKSVSSYYNIYNIYIIYILYPIYAYVSTFIFGIITKIWLADFIYTVPNSAHSLARCRYQFANCHFKQKPTDWQISFLMNESECEFESSQRRSVPNQFDTLKQECNRN